MNIIADKRFSDVIGWLPHGKGFVIYKKKKFAVEVLPAFFKKSKFTSFTRKLNRWGFVRVTRGPETGAYYHDLFRKGDLRLCMQMTCQPSAFKAATTAQQQQQSAMVANQMEIQRLQLINQSEIELLKAKTELEYATKSRLQAEKGAIEMEQIKTEIEAEMTLGTQIRNPID